MSDHDDLEALGYEFRDGAWHLVDPDRKPPARPNVCRMCRQFDVAIDGWCWPCLYFGPGDPHGLRVEHPRAETPEVVRQVLEQSGMSREEMVKRIRDTAKRRGLIS
jgi:hypothetical protein